MWPAPAGSQTQDQTQIKTFQNAFKQSSASHLAQQVTTQQQVDHPHKWLQQGEAVEAPNGHRVSRSRSKSKNIMERARSFERARPATSRRHSQSCSHMGPGLITAITPTSVVRCVPSARVRVAGAGYRPRAALRRGVFEGAAAGCLFVGAG